MTRALSVAFALCLVACTGGAGSTGTGEGEGSGTGTGEGSGSGRSSEGTASGSQPSGGESTSPGSTPPPSNEPSEEEGNTPGTSTDGPPPQCVSFAAHYCGCLPSARSDCQATQAENCDLGLGVCEGRYTKWMACIQSKNCKNWSDCSSTMSDKSIPCD